MQGEARGAKSNQTLSRYLAAQNFGTKHSLTLPATLVGGIGLATPPSGFSGPGKARDGGSGRGWGKTPSPAYGLSLRVSEAGTRVACPVTRPR
jgi:hypothetical protein